MSKYINFFLSRLFNEVSFCNFEFCDFELCLTPCLKDMECDGTVFSDMGCDGTIQLDAKSWILDFANLDCG